MNSVGTLKRMGPYWRVEAEPHVMLVFRRLFARVKIAHGAASVKNTPEICADLRWFMQRYVLDAPRAELQLLNATAEQYDQDIDDYASLVGGLIEPRSFSLALPPRPYQSVAADLCMRSKGMILGDELGLGKTIVGICILSMTTARPGLVVTLTHLPRQWEAEIKRFLPEAWVHVIRKGTPYDVTTKGAKGTFHIPHRRDLSGAARFPDVLITTYSKLRGWSGVLSRVCKSVIFDECQELRNDDSQRYRAAQHIASNANYCLGLSATPVFNYGVEMWNILNVIKPDQLGTAAEFRREWCHAGPKGAVRDPQTFGRHLRAQGLYLRRTREDVGRQLPPLTVVIQTTSTDQKALDAVEGIAGELARMILNEDGADMGKGVQWQAAGQLDWRLRQATGIAKAPHVAAFVRLLVESGEKVLLYGWHHAVFDIWREHLDDLGYVQYTGRESASQKAEAKAQFCRQPDEVDHEHPAAQVMAMSLRAGQGIDGIQYSGCRVVVFGELDWSPAIHWQGGGRVLRDGLVWPATFYFCIAESGSDPIVAGVLGVKKMQARGVLDPEGTDIRPVSEPDRVKRMAEAYLEQSGASR